MSRVTPKQRRQKTTEAAPAAEKKTVPRPTAKARRRAQPKLDPGDRALEREAEAYAGGTGSRALTTGGAAPQSLRGGGRPLPTELRLEHEARLGRDLSDLRIHDDPMAAQEAADLGARAFAENGDVVFAAGRYQPETEGGHNLIAHEVAHAAQQADARGVGAALQEEELTLRPEVPAPEVFHAEGGGISASVYFGQGDFLLGSRGVAAVEEIRRSLAGMLAGASVVIDAHASGEGTDEFNQDLSERRRMAVQALLTQGVGVELAIAGAAQGEAMAAGSETTTAAAQLESQRALNRRVDITIVPTWTISPDAPTPETPPLDLTVLPEIPPLPPIRPDRDILTLPPTLPEPPSFSFCGVWSERTRDWFDDRLRDLGIGEDLRGFLADRGVGLVERLATTAVEEGLDAAGASRSDRDMIMTTLRAACQQEFRP